MEWPYLGQIICMQWPHCSEVCNIGRCHYTLMNPSRVSFGSLGEVDLQFNVFPVGHSPWIAESLRWRIFKKGLHWELWVQPSQDLWLFCYLQHHFLRGPGIDPSISLFSHQWPLQISRLCLISAQSLSCLSQGAIVLSII